MFLYFLPGEKLNGKAQLIDPDRTFKRFRISRSLHDIVDGHAYTAYETTIDGAAGVFLAPHLGGVPAANRTYQKDKQEWAAYEFYDASIDQNYKLYIGFETKKPPSPETLIRSRTFGGYNVTDANGQEWGIPIARSVRGNQTLPSIYEFDFDTEAATAVPDPEFSELWDVSGQLYSHWCEDIQLSKTKIAQHAMLALSVNYRLGPIEHDVLANADRSILNTIVATTIAHALIDLQVQEPQEASSVEKKEPAVETAAVENVASSTPTDTTSTTSSG